MHYCLVLCRVSSTDQIYYRAAKWRGDKFDRSMTRGKLLDNDTQLFIFISILIMTQLHQRDPENRQQNRFSERRFSEKKTVTTGWMGKRGLSANNAQLMSVDLIGEKNQVILELTIIKTTKNCQLVYLFYSSKYSVPITLIHRILQICVVHDKLPSLRLN